MTTVIDTCFTAKVLTKLGICVTPDMLADPEAIVAAADRYKLEQDALARSHDQLKDSLREFGAGQKESVDNWAARSGTLESAVIAAASILEIPDFRTKDGLALAEPVVRRLHEIVKLEDKSVLNMVRKERDEALAFAHRIKSGVLKGRFQTPDEVIAGLEEIVTNNLALHDNVDAIQKVAGVPFVEGNH